MSTKIYNGYILPRLSLSQLKAFCATLQGKILVTRKALILRQFPDYTQKWLELVELHRDTVKKGMFDPVLDFSCSAVFFPHRLGTLALLYTVQPDFRKMWERSAGVKDFAYWNNSDQPKGISDKQWAAREAAWYEVLGDDGYGIPGEQGFTYVFTPETMPLPYKIQPELLKRAAKRGRHIVERGKVKHAPI